MKAIEFSNKFSGLIKDFFSLCTQHQELKIQQMQNIEFTHYDKGFTLKLETKRCTYLQGFNNDNKEIIPLFFNVIEN